MGFLLQLKTFCLSHQFLPMILWTGGNSSHPNVGSDIWKEGVPLCGVAHPPLPDPETLSK